MSRRSTIVSGLARRILSRGNGGFDLSRIGALPRRTLLPLLRNGLDPDPALRSARERAAVTRLPTPPLGLRVWLVTGYEAARAVLSDADGYSTDFRHLAGVAADSLTSPGGLGFADPPLHTRLRHLLTPEFTMRRLARLTPRIHEIVAERLVAVAAADPPVDLVREFALPIPSLVICELLGVPYADRARFQAFAMSRFAVDTGAARSLGTISDSLAYLRTVVERERRKPGDGLLGMIIREHGNAVDDDELTGLADGVLTGGFETTASMIALGALVLLRDDHAFTLVAAYDDAVGPFVEEVLRYLSVVQVAFPRFARRDVVVAGTRIAAGDMVIVSLSGANRDPALGGGLESLDPTRSPLSHLAFGHGIHRCVGAELARMELRAAYPALVRRFPRMQLAVRTEQLDFHRASIVYGLARLPVYPEPGTRN
jgi:cytochrome P450